MTKKKQVYECAKCKKKFKVENDGILIPLIMFCEDCQSRKIEFLMRLNDVEDLLMSLKSGKKDKIVKAFINDLEILIKRESK